MTCGRETERLGDEKEKGRKCGPIRLKKKINISLLESV